MDDVQLNGSAHGGCAKPGIHDACQDAFSLLLFKLCILQSKNQRYFVSSSSLVVLFSSSKTGKMTDRNLEQSLE